MERNLTDYSLFFQKKQSNPSYCAPFTFPILRLLSHKEAIRNTRTQPLRQRTGILCLFLYSARVESRRFYLYLYLERRQTIASMILNVGLILTNYEYLYQ